MISTPSKTKVYCGFTYQNVTFNDLTPDKFENVKAVFEKMVQKNDDVEKNTSKNKQVLIDMTNILRICNAQ